MKALILCAGKGTRLGKLTKNTPKCMIKVAGKPVLEHLVEHLNMHNIFKIIVNIHYKPHKIMNYFGNRLLYFHELKLLGEEGTIQALRFWLEKDWFVVMNGDTLTDIDINKLQRIYYEEKDAPSAIESWSNGIYTGTKVCSPKYYERKPKKVELESYWQDTGTPEGLAKARKHYEKIGSMS